ncbi:Uma2 family endonuclease [Kribbella albertanoniae]|uniref:Uma2 family endonuclease n=1 Tax=Kribbella albertanoniae TaxID=1266829 RepID=A0A4R4NZ09_9ACTN|nr:Uma2 family endonuclease [Kribbella albertanoniae]TDC14384.1 Uma2 family endonuclease [Kribbella albertanoniae]
MPDAPTEPYGSDPYTLAYLDTTPDNGKRHEIIDGVLFITPAPGRNHQRALTKLMLALGRACPRGPEVLPGPYDYRPTAERSLQPDLFVLAPDDTNPAYTEDPLLVVEIISPHTRLIDRHLKRQVYLEAGLPSYWIFEPEDRVLTVLELENGQYIEQTFKDDEVFDAPLPFPVRIVPAELNLL